MQFLYLCLGSLFVILVVDVIYYVKLFFVVVEELFLFLDRELHLALLEEYLWEFLIIYYVVGVADWSQLTVWDFLGVGLIAFKVDNIEIFLILYRLLLHDTMITRWLTKDFALLSSVITEFLTSSSGL